MRQADFTQLSLELPSTAERRPDGPRPERSHRSLAGRARLTLGEAARIIRQAVKDKSYRSTPLGQLVGRYLRWFRNEYGATESTLRDYEAVLARMSLLLADRQPLEVSTEDLREVIDTWAMRHARTRAKVTSVIRAFWVWAEEEGHVPFSPASKIRRPRAPRKMAPLLPAHVDELLLGCARTSRDRLALLVLLDCGSGAASSRAFGYATSISSGASSRSSARARRSEPFLCAGESSWRLAHTSGIHSSS